MSLPKERITYLLEAYTSKTATATEEQELMDWIEEAEEDSELKAYMQTMWYTYKQEKLPNAVDWNSMFNEIMDREKVHTIRPQPKRIYWMKIAAAAVIIVLMSLAVYYTTNLSAERIATTETKKFENDIAAPQISKAILTLADGTTIVLDSAGIGRLAVEGNVDVVKNTDGQIAYLSEASSVAAEVKYNKLTVPKGSKPAHLLLADGSNVWINVASSITYPTRFTGNERKVMLSGEAYFEVAQDQTHPFLVQTDQQTIKVIGTHFNVNDYNEEPAAKTTLLEGSVSVYAGSKNVVLKPGQQAVLAGKIVQVVSADTEDETAWINGRLQFSEESLGSIMRKVSRWYDVEIEYANEEVKALPLTGVIAPFSNVSGVLRMMELTKQVHFKIEGKKIIVIK